MPQNERVTSNQTGTAAGTDAGGPAGTQPHGGTLGLGQGTALYIASVLGTGILVLPGLAAAAAGPASIVAVAAVLVLSIPLAGTFASLAARYPDPGGVASYVRRTLGGTAARMTGYWFFFGVCIGAPVLAVLGGEYVVAVLGVDRAAVPIIALAHLRAAVRGQLVRRQGRRLGAVRAHGPPDHGRRRRRRGDVPRGRGVELPAVPAQRVGRRRHRDQPLRVGVRRLGGRHAHRGRVQEPSAHHPPRHRHRHRRRRRRVPRTSGRDGRRARRPGGRGRRAAPGSRRDDRCPASGRRSSRSSRRSSASA